MKGRVAIIGMGWLGTAFANACQQQGIRVCGTGRSIPSVRGLPNGISRYAYSLGTPLPVPICRTDEPYTAVIAISPNKAALPPLQFERGLRMLAGNLVDTPVERIVYVSATSVYPDHLEDAKETDAADIPSPRSGISMLRAENAIREGAGSVPVITVRFGGLFGPGREPGRFFVRRPLKFPDDPVNLIHLDDCIGVLTLAMGLNQTQVINAVAPYHPERGVFYTAAALAIGEQPPMSLGPARSDAPKRINSDRLIKDLGYEFIHPNPLSLYF